MNKIDLGLPSGTLWGDCNLGANTPIEYGDYFAWGDVSPKSNYIGRTCETYELNMVSLKLEEIVKNISNNLNSAYDAASQILGSKWCIPSGGQAQELIDNCSWQLVDSYDDLDIKGMLGTSKINGAKIFLPAAGYKNNTQLLLPGLCGGYWTSSPNLTSANRAWSIAFEGNLINVFNHGLRYNGYSIRPVTH